MIPASVLAVLNHEFPWLQGDGFAQTSAEDPGYNCIAWAAGDTANWWWPGGDFWPPAAPPEESLGAFVAAYGTVGYEPCQGGALEFSHEKVVIYCSAAGTPTHAARQLDDGCWTSKLGNFWDISHGSPRGVEGPKYGQARQFLRRRVSADTAAARFRRWSHAWYRG